MAFTRKPVEGDLINSERRFKQSLRYLIKVADSSVCEFCNEVGVGRNAVIRFESRGTLEIPKFLGYSVGLYRLANKHGRLHEFDSAYRQAVGYNLSELMLMPLD